MRLVEVDVDTSSCEKGHVGGAVGLNWDTQLCDQVRRDLLGPAEWGELLSGIGVSNDTTVIAYGDNNNWFAAWFVWQLIYNGHADARLMDGGRLKWEKENRTFTDEVPSYPAGSYTADEAKMNRGLRAFRKNVEEALQSGGGVNLVDVRSPGLNETCQRGGHTPGAANIPWGKAVEARTAPSNRGTSSRRSTRGWASPPTSPPSPTAGSGSGAATPGSF